jgi:23S rRNA pseudouridine2605 synthase
MYLSQYIAQAGVCSRRNAIDFIKNGFVEVNGKKIVVVSCKVKQGDVIKLKGKILKPERKIYILLNKPKNYVTTTSDEQGKNNVINLVKLSKKERLYPVGRLDKNTTGLLLLSNDGDLTLKLTHPKNQIKKVYHAVLDQPLTHEDFIKIKKGVRLREGKFFADKIFYKSSKSKKDIIVEIHSGKKRIIRRLFNAVGYNVIKLDRIAYAFLTKKGLPIGRWRFLLHKEVKQLKH